MRPLKQAEPFHSDPDQLLEMLEAQLLARRARRGLASRNRGLLLLVGLVVIFAGAGVVLSLLFAKLDAARPTAHEAVSAAAEVQR